MAGHRDGSVNQLKSIIEIHPLKNLKKFIIKQNNILVTYQFIQDFMNFKTTLKIKRIVT